MRTGEARTRLHVAYGQYCLMNAVGDLPKASTGGTGLVGAQGETAFVLCGIHTGSIELTVRTHDGAVPVDLGSWDDVVEVGMDCPDGRLVVAGWGGGASAFNLASGGPGAYRLRVHARGRDAARDGDPGDGPLEHHLIEVWPGADQTTIIYKATDQIGAYRRFAERDQPSTITSAPSDMAVFGPPPWDSAPRGEADRRVPCGRVLVRAPTLEITLTAVVVYSTGWMFELSAHAIRGDQDENRWRRIGRIVGQGFVSLNGPGRPPTSHQDGLRLSVAYEGHPAVTTARTIETAPELLPPHAPSFTGYWQGGSVLGNTVHAQYRAWLWPTPPAGPIALTLQWNALGIAPVTVELDITSLN